MATPEMLEGRQTKIAWSKKVKKMEVVGYDIVLVARRAPKFTTSRGRKPGAQDDREQGSHSVCGVMKKKGGAE